MKGRHRIIRATGGRVALLNTSKVPDEKIIAWIRFIAREVDVDKVVVHVKNTRGGYAYQSIPWIANLNGLKRSQWRYLITTEPSLRILAHEFKHIEQFKERIPRKNRTWERNARWFANLIVKSWKEERAALQSDPH